MSQFRFESGQRLRIGENEFEILRKLPNKIWQLENIKTRELKNCEEDNLTAQHAKSELIFISQIEAASDKNDKKVVHLKRNLATFPKHLVEKAKNRLKYIKEIERHWPMPLSKNDFDAHIKAVAEQIGEQHPPSWRTIYRDFKKWMSSGKNIRALIPRYEDRGACRDRINEEVKEILDKNIDKLYLTKERGNVRDVYNKTLNQIFHLNRNRNEDEKLKAPSERTVQRHILRIPAYDRESARYGKHTASMKYRTTGKGPKASRPLERVTIDHTIADIMVVDENSRLPLGRPTITTALDEFTRCLLGVYIGFEPPSLLAVMRCLKHTILSKQKLREEFPSIINDWKCYGLPDNVIVDNGMEFLSTQLEEIGEKLGFHISYARIKVPYYKGKMERFYGTLNRGLLHGTPGTTFSNIFKRGEYDPSKHAVLSLRELQEVLFKWICDIYLQTPQRGFTESPAAKWAKAFAEISPPTVSSAESLDEILGITCNRTLFHYGIELNGLTYNSETLGELRRRYGTKIRVEVFFDPGDLGHIYVLDPDKDSTFRVPAIDMDYSKNLTLSQHKRIKEWAREKKRENTDIFALVEAKEEIRKTIETASQKKKRMKKSDARFLGKEYEGSKVCAEKIEYFKKGKENKLIPVTEDLRAIPSNFSGARLQKERSPLVPYDRPIPIFKVTFDLKN